MCFFTTFHYVPPAEIVEEAVFCAVQSQRARTPAEVLQESRGEGQAARRDRFITVRSYKTLFFMQCAIDR